MLEQHVQPAITRQRLRSGPASRHIDDFAAWLNNKGYEGRSLFRMLQSFAAWTDWLVETDGASENFAVGLRKCTEYVTSLPRVRYRFGPNRQSLNVARLFLSFLREHGILLDEAVDPCTDRFPILQDFRSWMSEHRGVTVTTLDKYQRVLSEFLAVAGTDPHAYRADVLRNFVLNMAERRGAESARLGGTALRSFVRFLGVTGQCAAGLEYALPPFRAWKSSSIPRFLPSNEVNQIIASCPRDKVGIRDKAILLLLARLALRAGDVVRLRIIDIDWAKGHISVSGKGRREDLLPLPREIGAALLRYLKSSRPPSRAAELFLTVPPPFRRLSYQAVGGIVHRAIVRANVISPFNGAHVLRHSSATSMLAEGASLASIGSVLRHRSPRTTARYAKVDIALLSTIAQPWPEVASC